MIAQAGTGYYYFNLFLKSTGYSVAQTNTLPTAGSALSIVAAVGFGILVDRTGWRLSTTIALQILVAVSNILLWIWNLPRPVLLFANYLSYVGAAAQPIIIVRGFQRPFGTVDDS
jgi:MFS transporter, ACS family, pantothenate transporter